jgi:hypothetical protein
MSPLPDALFAMLLTAVFNTPDPKEPPTTARHVAFDEIPNLCRAPLR